MSDDDPVIGSPITIAELKALGEFTRWQDLGPRVAKLVDRGALQSSYPLTRSRVPRSKVVDLWVGGRWRQVDFVRIEGTALGGNRRIIYSEGEAQKSAQYDRYKIAPAGHFTDWSGARPAALSRAKLLETYELAQPGHVIHSQELERDGWPYLTFEARSYHPKARWVNKDDMWIGSHTVHAADPRVSIDGVVAREPWFNTTIAISHRWLHPDHPDPDGRQFSELVSLCETGGLRDAGLVHVRAHAGGHDSRVLTRAPEWRPTR
jgi:hypothetical protein